MKRRRARRAAVVTLRSRGGLRDQCVEPGRDEGEVLLVLQRDADRALERVRPARAALVEQRRRLRPVDRLGNAGRLAQWLPPPLADGGPQRAGGGLRRARGGGRTVT